MKKEDVSQDIKDLAGERAKRRTRAQAEEHLDKLLQDCTDSGSPGDFVELDDDTPIDAVVGENSKPNQANSRQTEEHSGNRSPAPRDARQNDPSARMKEASEQISDGIRGVSSSLVDRGRSLVDQKIDSFRNTLLQDESKAEVPKLDLKNENKVEATKSVIEVILFVLEKVLLLPVYVFGKYLGLFMSKEFEGKRKKVLLISAIFSLALALWEVHNATYDFWKLIFPIMADLIVIIL